METKSFVVRVELDTFNALSAAADKAHKSREGFVRELIRTAVLDAKAAGERNRGTMSPWGPIKAVNTQFNRGRYAAKAKLAAKPATKPRPSMKLEEIGEGIRAGNYRARVGVPATPAKPRAAKPAAKRRASARTK